MGDWLGGLRVGRKGCLLLFRPVEWRRLGELDLIGRIGRMLGWVERVGRSRVEAGAVD